ncbi:MAG: hypothetical protein ABL923_15020, partial [Burkholderiaceae bacterium]
LTAKRAALRSVATMPINLKMSMILKIQESNFDVVRPSAELQIVLNWNLTLISLPRLLEASLDRQPSNEGSFFRPAGREKAGDESGGNKPACAAAKCYK